jgi:hypothetical protein
MLGGVNVSALNYAYKPWRLDLDEPYGLKEALVRLDEFQVVITSLLI